MIDKILVFLCATVLLAGATVFDPPEEPCCQEDELGVKTCYPVGAKWASKVPGACLEYTCNGPDDITSIGCPTNYPDCTGDNVCYMIGMPFLTYPYCCVAYACYSSASLP